jgi:poly(A) polymerase
MDQLSDNIRYIYKALNEAGAHSITDKQTLFVGGCVRDWLLKRAVSDFDMATIYTPQEVMTRLENAGAKAIPTGLDHGTVTAVYNGASVEITTLREDVSTDGRRATVSFTTDWKKDAARRDFTINTLLCDDNGNIYDPLGCGEDDLKAKRIAFVGAPQDRIQEDYLRILRYFRFLGLFPDTAPDPIALEACRRFSAHLSSLSQERITDEIFKMMAFENDAEVFRSMFENHVLRDFFTDDFNVISYQLFSRFLEVREGYIEAKLFFLARLTAQPVSHLTTYLSLSRAHKTKIQDILKAYAFLKNDKALLQHAIYKFGYSPTYAAAAALSAEQGDDDCVTKATSLAQWHVPILPLSGDDVLRAGIQKGCAVGQALSFIEKWWMQNDFQPDKQACFAHLDNFTAQ